MYVLAGFIALDRVWLFLVILPISQILFHPASVRGTWTARLPFTSIPTAYNLSDLDTFSILLLAWYDDFVSFFNFALNSLLAKLKPLPAVYVVPVLPTVPLIVRVPFWAETEIQPVHCILNELVTLLSSTWFKYVLVFVVVVVVFAVAADVVPMMFIQVLCGLAGIVTVRAVPLTSPIVSVLDRLKVGLEFTTIPVQFNVLLSTFTQTAPVFPQMVIWLHVESSETCLQLLPSLSQMFVRKVFTAPPSQSHHNFLSCWIIVCCVTCKNGLRMRQR